MFQILEACLALLELKPKACVVNLTSIAARPTYLLIAFAQNPI